MLETPRDILEDLLARKIYEASIAGGNETLLEGTIWQKENMKRLLEDKGYQLEVISKRLLKVFFN